MDNSGLFCGGKMILRKGQLMNAESRREKEERKKKTNGKRKGETEGKLHFGFVSCHIKMIYKKDDSASSHQCFIIIIIIVI